MRTYAIAAGAGCLGGILLQTLRMRLWCDWSFKKVSYALAAATVFSALAAIVTKLAGEVLSRPALKQLALPALKVSAHGAVLSATFLFGLWARWQFYNKVKPQRDLATYE